MKTNRVENHISYISKRFWFSILRLITIVLLLGSGFMFLEQSSFTYTLLTLYAAFGLIYFIYVFFSKDYEEEFIGSIVIIQIAGEILIEGLLVNHFGGNFSPFILFFILTIISSAPYFYLVGSITVATVAGLLYSLPVFFDLSFIYEGLIEAPKLAGMGISSDEAFYTVFLHLCIFYFFAFISRFLAENMFAATRELSKIKLEINEILEQLQSGLLTVDNEGRIVYFNKAAGEILDLDPEDIKGKIAEEALPPELRNLSKHIRLNLKSGRSPGRTEIIFKHEQRGEIPVGLSFSTIKDDSKNLRGLIALFQDLTKIKKLNERLRTNDRLAAVGELAAGIAHEIRNPLASISGSVELLKDELQLDGDNKKLLDLIIKESSRLNTIITDFLSFARIGKSQSGQCDLVNAVNDVLKLAKSHDQIGSNIDLSFDFHKPLIMIPGGEDQIKQVVWNLIINSAQAIGDGDGMISIKISETVSEEFNSKIRFVITDNGPGISADVQKHIFDPFYSTKTDGTGLGLPIVARITDSLDGQIEIESSPGSGTSFILHFPSETVDSKQVTELQEIALS